MIDDPSGIGGIPLRGLLETTLGPEMQRQNGEERRPHLH